MVYQVNTPAIAVRIRCKSVYGFRIMKNMNLKQFVVQRLCPDIIKDDRNMREEHLKLVLANNAEVRRFNNKYICILGEKQYVFDEEPTPELLKRYETMRADFSQHIRAVEDMLAEILRVCKNKSAFRQVKAFSTRVTVHEQPDMYVRGVYVKRPPFITQSVVRDEIPACKGCGWKQYFDCTTHFTCKRCSVVRDKIHQGLAYREMRDRNVDMNGRSMEISNIYSESFQRRSDIRMNPAKDKKPYPKNDFKSLERANDMMNTYTHGKKDKQMFLALEEMENVCAPLQLRDGVVRKAHVLYCRYRKAVETLRSEKAVMAACLFHALPPEIKIVQRKRKRPVAESPPKVKHRKLKFVDFKKPVERRKRSHSLLVRLMEKRSKKLKKKPLLVEPKENI